MEEEGLCLSLCGRGEGLVVGFLPIASPQQGDLRLLGPSPGQSAGGEARTHDRKEKIRNNMNIKFQPSGPRTQRPQVRIAVSFDAFSF
ncbi:hypothetical protein PoB_007486500 [Plakobranchus ocellatus]|uniref:Uncharacterized protein n=1 Tax=Plakobranchus ocellatus TaxID=259542 RepID=A0AAV4DWC3_9GAST|nr:hypothetical protein PoB_007486500 [Plakobranchus ocellatus]